MTNDRPQTTLPAPCDYPDPVVQYSLTESGAVIEAVNDPFRAVFGSPESTDSLETILDITSPADSEALKTGGTISVTIDETRQSEPDATVKQYHGRVVSPGKQAGYILFVAGGHDIGVDRVASVISHDLRNPLDVAKAHLEAVEDITRCENIAPESRLPEHLAHIEHSHGRMERIIEDVLTLARGDAVITPDTTVDLKAVAERAWETVDTGSATLSVDNSLQTVTGDPDRLGRLFENLFRNAIEHGTPHSGTVAVRVRTISDGFFVEDNGPGIPPDRRDQIFHPGHSNRIQGTGLGLAIVRRIAEHHGWSVAAEDGDSGGARIAFHGVTGE